MESYGYSTTSSAASTNLTSAAASSDHLKKYERVLLKSVFFLNACHSKLLITGVHMRDCFFPFVEILGANGKGIRLTLNDWVQFVRQVDILNSYVFENGQDVNNIPEKEVGQHTLFVHNYCGRNVIGLKSPDEGIYLGEVSCRNIVKHSKIVEFILMSFLGNYKGIDRWYSAFLLNIKRKYQNKLNALEEEGRYTTCLSLEDFVKSYIQCLRREEEFITENLEKIVYELGPEFIYKEVELMSVNAVQYHHQ